MIVAGGRPRADGASGAAAGAGDFEVADRVLLVSEMLVSQLSGKKDQEEEEEREELGRRLTAAQQNSPQQDSPAMQNVFPQHVDPVGMQKGATLEDVGMQH